MQLQDAIRTAPSYLQNAQETAQRSPVNPDTLYLWDNQVTAIEQFLANTEDLAAQDPSLAAQRKSLLDLKKAIQNKVLEFELKAEGQDVPPEPTEDELVQELLILAEDVEAIVKKIEKAPLNSVKDIDKLEEPREMLNAFLVDTEPLAGRNAELDGVRAKAKQARAGIETKINDLIRQWRVSDAGGDDEDD